MRNRKAARVRPAFAARSARKKSLPAEASRKAQSTLPSLCELVIQSLSGLSKNFFSDACNMRSPAQTPIFPVPCARSNLSE